MFAIFIVNYFQGCDRGGWGSCVNKSMGFWGGVVIIVLSYYFSQNFKNRGDEKVFTAANL